MNSFIRWLPSLLWMAVIFYLSSRTGEDLGGWLDSVRRWVPMMEGFNWGHFAAYFILAWTYLWALRPKRLSLGIRLVVVLMCVLYGVTDEYHQSFVPGRTPDLMDLRNDAIGAALAMLLLYLPFVRRWYSRLSGAKYY
ncbi:MULTISPECIES: VanZ family protein [unclassified Paenibacillus]|uniref:VanZ family protein n=1 Tax=unclassified Paenibacillus TaxID=185978 RepID=UPI001AE5CE99|nr:MULTISPECIES: VanZ family protein [unclassified Paenibacillus]MBP1156136.1 VanZ family protein [Paenibacillus sp. PvP091]MBP1168478.1 VanZ family protein [Paenibacillus sp. PvR098]MBP2439506.1 VanZ family protein [Paenibacillus sp. PvP052]